MAAITSESFCFLIVCFLFCSSEAQTNIRHKKITAELGENVILPCKVPNNIRAAEWSRPDQEGEYVLFYRDGLLDPNGQHPSYQNRVDLQDKELKDGHFSLILKKVKMEDNGRYVCQVFGIGKNELISIINLEVHPPECDFEYILDGEDTDEREMDRFIAGPVVGVMLVVVLVVLGSVGFWFCRRRRRQNPNLPVPHDDESAVEKMF